MFKKRRLGEMLVGMGAITQGQLADALDDQRTTGGLLGQILIRRGACTHMHITEALLDQATGLLDEQENSLRSCMVDISGWREFVHRSRHQPAVQNT